MCSTRCSRGGRAQPAGLAGDGDIHYRERRDRLGLAVLEYLQIAAAEIADELSLLVQDTNVQLNRVDFSAEGGRLLRDQCGGAGADSEQGDSESTEMPEGTD